MSPQRAPKGHEDEHSAEAARLCDEAARLCKRWSGEAVGYLIQRGTDWSTAEDHVQDAAFIVVQDKYREMLTHPWPKRRFFQIVRWVAKDNRLSTEARAAREQMLARQTHRPAPDPASSVVCDIDLHRALQKLPRRQREVVYLCCCVGFSTEDVALILDLATSTVRGHRRSGELAIRTLLDGYFEEGEHGGE